MISWQVFGGKTSVQIRTKYLQEPTTKDHRRSIFHQNHQLKDDELQQKSWNGKLEEEEAHYLLVSVSTEQLLECENKNEQKR